MGKTFKDERYIHLNKKLMQTIRRDLSREHPDYFRKKHYRFNVPSNA